MTCSPGGGPSPVVEDRGDQADDDRAADRGPESRYRKSFDQVSGEFQQERVDHNEEQSQREDDQGKGQHKENGSQDKI